MNFTNNCYPFRRKFRQDPVLRGTCILTFTGLVTRVIGFYNRIFLSRLIGAKELGIYQLIFPLYMLAFALTTCGGELALTRLVSQYHKRGDDASAFFLFRICFAVNTIVSVLTAFIMYRYADFLCTAVLRAPECTACVRILIFGIPFMSMKGAIHGYFLGLEQSGVHGMSDFLEQTAKVLGLYLLSVSFFATNISFDAAFATYGIVIGEIVAFLYCLHMLHRHASGQIFVRAVPSALRRSLANLFLRNTVPFTLNRISLTALQCMESVLIPVSLLTYCGSSTESLAIYGTFTGMAFPFIMFPATVTNALSTMLMPAVSSAAVAEHTRLPALCKKSVCFCLAIGVCSATVFYLFGNAIGTWFFQSEEAGAYLCRLSILCPFIYLSTTLASILNGLEQSAYNLLLTVIATGIRIAFILFAVPTVGMDGYILGLLTGYVFLTAASYRKLRQTIQIPTIVRLIDTVRKQRR